MDRGAAMGGGALARWLPLAALLLGRLAQQAACALSASDLQCQAVADTYLQHHHREASAFQGNASLVFFLHVPRTAGRTLHTCLLKKGTPQLRHCPRAYDHLRINTSLPNCFLLTSHDDFSVVSSLPEVPNVAVLSYLRDPVDRFLSAYEFAIEVGARGVGRKPGQPFRKKSPNAVITEEVWPWSYLAPFFTADIRQRRAQLEAQQTQQPIGAEGRWFHVRFPDGDEFYYNKVRNESKWNLTAQEATLLLPALDPYNNPLVMPLEEFVGHPIAQELLHNGQAFQVLGITNYSHWGDAGEMRGCVWSSEAVRAHLLDVARARIDKFLHVGATDRLMESVAVAAASLHMPLGGPVVGGASRVVEQGAHHQKHMLVEEQAGARGRTLGQEFQRCAFQAQQKNRQMESRCLSLLSMPDGRVVEFSKRARALIPASVIEKIRKLNMLDTALHTHASDLLTQHLAQLTAQGTYGAVPQQPPGMRIRVPNPNIPKPLGKRGGVT